MTAQKSFFLMDKAENWEMKNALQNITVPTSARLSAFLFADFHSYHK